MTVVPSIALLPQPCTVATLCRAAEHAAAAKHHCAQCRNRPCLGTEHISINKYLHTQSPNSNCQHTTQPRNRGVGNYKKDQNLVNNSSSVGTFTAATPTTEQVQHIHVTNDQYTRKKLKQLRTIDCVLHMFSRFSLFLT